MPLLWCAHIRCSLFDVQYGSMFVVRGSWFAAATLFVVRGSWFVVRRSLSSLFVVRCSLFAVRCSLFVVVRCSFEGTFSLFSPIDGRLTKTVFDND
jgi:hypothetical protein